MADRPRFASWWMSWSDTAALRLAMRSRSASIVLTGFVVAHRQGVLA